MDNVPKTKVKKGLEIEDKPEDECVIIEGINFGYHFFKQLSLNGVPIGSLLRVVTRQKHPKGGHSVVLQWIMTSEQASQHVSRIILPGGPGGKPQPH